MAHKRTDIRQAVVAMLMNNTAAASRVQASRILRLQTDELPAILVHAREEQVDRLTVSSSMTKRTLTILVEAYVEINDNLEDAMDAICLEIEDIIKADSSLQDTAIDSILTATSLELSGETERGEGKASLTFEVKYVSQ